MIASHHTAMITTQLFTSLGLLAAAGIVAGMALAARGAGRFAPVVVTMLALAVGGVGAYRLAEVPALQHNHLCHAHHDDSCNNDNAAEDEHTHGDHWFGGRAAD